VTPRFEFDPREVHAYVSKLAPREELIYRLVIRGLCERCRGDRAFTARTGDLMARFRNDLAAVVDEARQLAGDLAGRA